jgi:hypothetical protein
MGIQPNGIFTVGNTIFSSVNSNNFYPAEKSALINAGTNPQHQHVIYDFNGKLRPATIPTVGAYVSCLIQYKVYYVLCSLGIFDNDESWLSNNK